MTLDFDQVEPQVEDMAAYLSGRRRGEGRTEARVSLATIRPSRWQPRMRFDEEALWELAKSIEENGLINAVVVFPVDGGYELVAGERRCRAMAGLALGEGFDNHTPKEYVLRLANVGLDGLNERERAGLEGATIAARVEPADDLTRLHRMAVVENLERANLNPVEEARALHGLLEANGWSQRDLARHLGKSQSWVAQRLGLLDLPGEAQKAVEEDSLTLTHARALQGLPQTVAPAVVEHVTNRVRYGATTREIDGTVSQIKEFLDSSRYVLSENYVCPAKERNRMRLLRWLVEETDWQEQQDALVALAKHGNTLDGSPPELAKAYRLERVAKAVGYESISDAWAVFAGTTSRECESCAFGAWEWTGEEWETVNTGMWEPPCERWRADVGTCQSYIGPDDPEVVDLSWPLRRDFDRAELDYETYSFAHVAGVRAFVEMWGALEEYRETWEAEEKQEAKTGYIGEIQRYYEWMLSLPMAAVEHVRAHACTKCTHYVRGGDWDAYYNDRKAPRCSFVQEPLVDRRGDPRAPEFGAFVTEDGLMLPRCEMFAYANRPALRRVSGTTFVNREQVMDWLRALAGNPGWLWYKIARPLAWVDYGYTQNEDDPVELLIEHLLRIWPTAERWADEVMPTLLDCVMTEAKPRMRTGGALIELVNPVTGQRERFVPVDLDVALGENTFPGWRQYPEGWPRPWLEQPAQEAATYTLKAETGHFGITLQGDG